MRLRPVIAVALAALAVFCVKGVCEPPALELMAKVESVQGSVETRGKLSTEWRKLEKGETLKSGDYIKTGPGGSCTISWSRGNVVTLGPMTKMKIDSIRVVPGMDQELNKLSLESGRVFAKVQKLSGYSSKFEINTPTAVAGVRGTDLAVIVDEDGSSVIECHSGKVVVTSISGGEVILQGGQWTKVQKYAQPEEPKELDGKSKDAFGAAGGMGVPQIMLIDPLGDMETSESFLVVHGQTDPGTKVTVNDSEVDVSDGGFFTALAMQLQEGDNDIVVKAQGAGGESVERKLVVTYNPSAGQGRGAGAAAAAAQDEFDPGADIDVAVSYPPSGFITKKAEVTLTGKKTPGTKLFFNGKEDSTTPGSRTFLKTVTLDEEGENIFTFTVERGGKTKTISHKIIKDTTPPILEIFRPMNNQFDIMTGDCTLVGSYSDGDYAYCNIAGLTEADASLTIDDIRYEVEPDGSFDNQVALDPRDAVLLVAAEDQAGNRTIKVLTRVLRDMDETVTMGISVSPTQITGDNVSTANVTVTCLNYLGQPIDGIVVNLATDNTCVMSACGTLPSSVILNNGVGTATFQAGILDARQTVTITATSGSVSQSTNLLLLPDVPAVLER